jgi:hypothetical protein
VKRSGWKDFEFCLLLLEDGSYQFYILCREFTIEHKNLGFDEIEAIEDYEDEIREFILQIEKPVNQPILPNINSHPSIPP